MLGAMTFLARVADSAAAVAGQVFGQVLGAVAALRNAKPLHPRGVVHAGTLVRRGAATGVPLLDDAGPRPCLVRTSRSIGLPAPLPDIHGVALRLEEDGRPVDLLFATTGSGTLTRYVLRPVRSPQAALTTMMPLRTPSGALQLRLTPAGQSGTAQEWVLSVSTPARRTWEPIAHLVAGTGPARPDADPPLRFDPVRHVPAGASVDRWIRLVRDPSYVLARRRWPHEATGPV